MKRIFNSRLLAFFLAVLGFALPSQAQKYTRPVQLKRGAVIRTSLNASQATGDKVGLSTANNTLFLLSGGQPAGLSASFAPYQTAPDAPPVVLPPVVTPGNGTFVEIAEPTFSVPGGSYSWQFSQLPSTFSMPSNRTYVIWSGTLNEIKTAITQYGFTHLDATTLTKAALSGGALGSNQAVINWFNSNVPNAKLYSMIYDNYLQEDAGAKIPGFYDPANTTATASQVANALNLWVGNRASSFNLQNKCDIVSLDFEGLPSTTHKLTTIRDGIQLFKAQNPAYQHTDFEMPDVGPIGLYPNQSERYNTLKNTCKIGGFAPYIYVDRDRWANLAQARDSTAYWLYQQVKWKRMRNTWLNGELGEKPRTVCWTQGMWANFQDSDGAPMFIRNDIAAAFVPLYEVLGGGANNGGMLIWEDGKTHNIVLDYYVAGMWRVGQIKAPFEDANAQYDVPLEYSTNGGSTWQANQYGPYNVLGAIDTDKVYAEKKPYVLGMVGAGKLVVYATEPTLATGTKTLKVRYGGTNGKVFDIPIRARKSTFGHVSL